MEVICHFSFDTNFLVQTWQNEKESKWRFEKVTYVNEQIKFE